VADLSEVRDASRVGPGDLNTAQILSTRGEWKKESTRADFRCWWQSWSEVQSRRWHLHSRTTNLRNPALQTLRIDRCSAWIRRHSRRYLLMSVLRLGADSALAKETWPDWHDVRRFHQIASSAQIRVLRLMRELRLSLMCACNDRKSQPHWRFVILPKQNLVVGRQGLRHCFVKPAKTFSKITTQIRQSWERYGANSTTEQVNTRWTRTRIRPRFRRDRKS